MEPDMDVERPNTPSKSAVPVSVIATRGRTPADKLHYRGALLGAKGVGLLCLSSSVTGCGPAGSRGPAEVTSASLGGQFSRE